MNLSESWKKIFKKCVSYTQALEYKVIDLYSLQVIKKSYFYPAIESTRYVIDFQLRVIHFFAISLNLHVYLNGILNYCLNI